MFQTKDLEIFQALPTLFLIKDETGKYLWVNRAWTQATHRSLENVLGKNDHEVFSEKDAAAFIKVDQKVMESGETFRGQEQLTEEDGTLRTAMVCKFVAELDGKKCLFGIAIPNS